MADALTLLGEVSWHGRPVPGERQVALLALLVAAAPDAVPDERLVELWDAPPAHPAKAVQVVVARLRAATAPQVVARTAHGYRLTTDDVDLSRLERLAADAEAALAADELPAALRAAEQALAVPVGTVDAAPSALAPLYRRADAARRAARAVVGLASQAGGDDAGALPALLAAVADAPGDDRLLAALLRAEAGEVGPAAALDRYQRHRAELADRLGVDPSPALRAVHAELLAADRPVRTGVVFPLTTPVGRDDDVSAVTALVAGHRLVTITGAGGLGKTTVAQQVAAAARTPAVHVAELVAVTAGDDLLAQVAAAVGVHASAVAARPPGHNRRDLRARLVDRCGEVPTLLVLDNCEHLLDAVAGLVGGLLATVPTLRVLCTSRAPLGLAAEQVYPLPHLASDAAVQLFEQRARAARPEVRLDRAMVARVVDRLDGLPLAIELAAARVRVLSVEQVAARLDDRLSLLQGGPALPGRHRTLQQVIEWSWDLLSAPARRALTWLAPFAGGFSLDAAQAVLGAGSLTEVSALVDQSMLTVTEDGGRAPRYRMLETIREFGMRELTAAGGLGAALAAHREWAVGLVRRRGADLRSPAFAAAIRELSAEEANLTAEVRRALADGDLACVATLGAVLGDLWRLTDADSRVELLGSLAGALADAPVARDPVTDAPAAAGRSADAPVEPDGPSDTHAAPGGGTGAGTADVDPDEARLLLAGGLLAGAMLNRPVDPRVVARLNELGPGRSPWVVAAVRANLALVEPDAAVRLARLRELAASPDDALASTAGIWLSATLENAGDAAGGEAAARAALDRTPRDTAPGERITLRSQVAMYLLERDEVEEARPIVEEVAATIAAIEAPTTAAPLLAGLALARLRAGDPAPARALLTDLADVAGGRDGWMAPLLRAEIALHDGDRDAAWAALLDAVRAPWTPPNPEPSAGLDPWTLSLLAIVLLARVLLGPPPGGVPAGYDASTAHRRLVAVLRRPDVADYPVCGTLLHAVLAADLLGDGPPRFAPAVAAELLAISERWGRNRTTALTRGPQVAAAIELAAPGRLDAARRRHGGEIGHALAARALELLGTAD